MTAPPVLTGPSGRPIDRDSGKTLRLPIIHQRLVETYGDGVIELNWTTPLELLIATVLSAQSTDVMVNKITASLFQKYHEPEDYLAVPQEELEQDIKSSGFYRQKAKSIRGLCAGILERFDGDVPQTIAELITLPGVARKTANVVQSGAFPEAMATDPDAGIAVDTHVIRLSKRLGYTRHSDAVKIEQDLKRMYPRDQWSNASLVTILHGRRCCDALKPACYRCPVETLCPSSLAAGRTDKARQARGMGE
ncbi:endonuclease III [Stomatohabitans albus]|uniref:endonuclease III n=1 Tax=Stomatohabitans albus TaxID=3110766 RepID=UPI00300C0CA4